MQNFNLRLLVTKEKILKIYNIIKNGKNSTNISRKKEIL